MNPVMTPTSKRRFGAVIALWLILALVRPALATVKVPSFSANKTFLGLAGELIKAGIASGDFNCDGSLDLVFGTTGYDGGSATIYVVFGPLPSVPRTVNLAVDPPDIEISLPPRVNNFSVTMTIADLDADGCDDLVVGEPLADPSGWLLGGKVSLLYGRPDPPAQWLIDWSTRAPDLELFTAANFTLLGEALASGDFNGDGYLDLFVSSVSIPDTGQIHVLHGPIESAPGEVRNLTEDPAATTILGVGIPGTWIGSSLWTYDFNDDLRDDLVVGVPAVSVFSHQGQVTVLYGKEDTGAPVQWDLGKDPPDIMVHTGDATSYRSFGHEVRFFDFNDDGYKDMIVADPRFTYSVIGRGALIIVDGTRLTANVQIDLSLRPPDLTLIGAGVGWEFFDHFELLDSRQGSILLAAAPKATYNFLPKNGAVYRMNHAALLSEEDVVEIRTIQPAAVFHGSNFFETFGQALHFADLDGSGALELIVGANRDKYSSAVFLFFDRIEIIQDPMDDDDHDDPLPGPNTDLDIQGAKDDPNEPDFGQGCRCF